MDVTHIGMGTIMAHAAYGQNAEGALQALVGESLRLEKMLSRFVPESEISALNQAAGKSCRPVSAETFSILSEAKRLSVESAGAFDVTVGPLVDLWDFHHATSPPSPSRIRQTARLVNYRDLTLYPGTCEAMLRRHGQSLDLGGIGKGYASDAFMRLLQSMGITSAFSNLGGNVSTLGTRPDGSPWRVGIRHPRGEGLIGVVEVVGKAVVTSGDYELFFMDRSGRRYHHILDPRTGCPAASGLISVTVIADSAMQADALSTAVLASGIEKGLEWLKRCGTAQAILIDKHLNLYCSAGLSGSLQIITGIKPIIV